MNGLSGLNMSPNGVAIGLVQLQLPVVATPADLAAARCRLPWEDEVKVIDGMSCGFGSPRRMFGQPAVPNLKDAAE